MLVPNEGIWANQPVYLFLVGCLNPCLQGTSVWVGLPQPMEGVHPFTAFVHKGCSSNIFLLYSKLHRATLKVSTYHLQMEGVHGFTKIHWRGIMSWFQQTNLHSKLHATKWVLAPFHNIHWYDKFQQTTFKHSKPHATKSLPNISKWKGCTFSKYSFTGMVQLILTFTVIHATS